MASFAFRCRRCQLPCDELGNPKRTREAPKTDGETQLIEGQCCFHAAGPPKSLATLTPETLLRRFQGIRVDVRLDAGWACLEFREVTGQVVLTSSLGTWNARRRYSPISPSIGCYLAHASESDLRLFFGDRGSNWHGMWETYWAPHIRLALLGWPQGREDALFCEDVVPMEERK